MSLKPCPFCGGEAELLAVPAKSGLSPLRWVVKCIKGCCNQMPHLSDHDAIEEWNKRNVDKVIKELEEYLNADGCISEDEEYLRGWKCAMLTAIETVKEQM